MAATKLLSDNGVSSGITGYQLTGGDDGTLQLQTTTAGGAATTALTLDTSQNTTLAGYLNAPNTFGFKNRIINGAMMIDQRNAGASVTPTDGAYTLDRWVCGLSQASKFTVQRTPSATETGYATRVAAGFSDYLACTVGASANVTVGAGDVFAISQKIEGFNFADMAWGTANAKTVTLSFLAYSSVTGTFGGSFVNSANNRSYPFTYSIPTANTWTPISVTVAGDTSGTWVGATSGVGVKIWFSLGAGSSGSNTAGSWVGANSYSATGAVSPITTNGATFYITGVQLEKGTVATSFDFRSIGTELTLSKRYYQKTFPLTTAPAQAAGNAGAVVVGNTGDSGYGCQIPWRFEVQMRTTPTTITTYNPAAANANARNFATSANRTISVLPFGQNSMNQVCYTADNNATGDALGMAYGVHFSVEAEL